MRRNLFRLSDEQWQKIAPLRDPAPPAQARGGLPPAWPRGIKLYTGAGKASHVLEGTINLNDRTDVVAIHFKETPAL